MKTQEDQRIICYESFIILLTQRQDQISKTNEHL